MRYVKTNLLPTPLYKTVQHIETRFPDWSTAYNMQSNKKNLCGLFKKQKKRKEINHCSSSSWPATVQSL